jgi:hypothetical protein
MATQAHTDTRRVAKLRAFALIAAAVAALCAPLTARAEEPNSRLTVTAAVRSGCQVDAGAPVVGDSASTRGVALQCTRSVETRTSIAYETVGATDDRQLVVTVLF